MKVLFVKMPYGTNLPEFLGSVKKVERKAVCFCVIRFSEI